MTHFPRPQCRDIKCLLVLSRCDEANYEIEERIQEKRLREQ